MILAVLTNSYPFGNEEPFLEEEIRTCERLYDEIHIYSLAPLSAQLTRYVPQNAKVIMIRKKMGCFSKLRAIMKLLCPSTINEILFVRHAFRYTFKDAISKLFYNYFRFDKYIVDCLMNEDVNNTIFYSYWLSHLAFGLYKYKLKNGNAFCISRAHRFDNFIDFKASLFRREILTNLNYVYPISHEGIVEIENRIFPYIDKNYNKLSLHHIGVDLPNFRNPDNASNIIKIVSCSFVWKIKRLDILINALEQIQDVNISWTHFGGGKDFEEIQRLASEKLGTKYNISYQLMGQTDHDEILRFYRDNHVDIFINCSDHEGIPVSIMEAMATGIICIARDVGGNKELVVNLHNGILLSADAGGNEFAKAILSYIEFEEQKLIEMRDCAREKIIDEFSSPLVFEQFHLENIHKFSENLS